MKWATPPATTACSFATKSTCNQPQPLRVHHVCWCAKRLCTYTHVPHAIPACISMAVPPAYTHTHTCDMVGSVAAPEPLYGSRSTWLSLCSCRDRPRNRQLKGRKQALVQTGVWSHHQPELVCVQPHTQINAQHGSLRGTHNSTQSRQPNACSGVPCGVIRTPPHTWSARLGASCTTSLSRPSISSGVMTPESEGGGGSSGME